MQKPRIQVRGLLDQVPNETHLIFAKVAGLRAYLADLKASAATNAAQSANGSSPRHVENNLPPTLQWLRSDEGAHLASAQALLSVLEGSDIYRNAAALLEPLFAELTALEAEEAELARATGAAQAAKNEAQAATRAKADELVSKCPIIRAAAEAHDQLIAQKAARVEAEAKAIQAL